MNAIATVLIRYKVGDQEYGPYEHYEDTTSFNTLKEIFQLMFPTMTYFKLSKRVIGSDFNIICSPSDNALLPDPNRYDLQIKVAEVNTSSKKIIYLGSRPHLHTSICACTFKRNVKPAITTTPTRV